MPLGMIGLGRMGANMGLNLLQHADAGTAQRAAEAGAIVDRALGFSA